MQPLIQSFDREGSGSMSPVSWMPQPAFKRFVVSGQQRSIIAQNYVVLFVEGKKSQKSIERKQELIFFPHLCLLFTHLKIFSKQIKDLAPNKIFGYV